MKIQLSELRRLIRSSISQEIHLMRENAATFAIKSLLRATNTEKKGWKAAVHASAEALEAAVAGRDDLKVTVAPDLEEMEPSMLSVSGQDIATVEDPKSDASIRIYLSAKGAVYMDYKDSKGKTGEATLGDAATGKTVTNVAKQVFGSGEQQ